MTALKKGLTAPRPGAVKMEFRSYLSKASLPKRPVEFGHENLVRDFHMLGNDLYGNCAWAGAAHETYILTAMAGYRAHVLTANTLEDYGACTGFKVDDPTTDRGTDMQAAASYRRTIGIKDFCGKRHKIAAYADIPGGDLDAILTAAWLFGVAPIGVMIGDEQEEQFRQGQPWSGDPGKYAGGHYVPVVARRHGLTFVVTWGKVHPVTDKFIVDSCNQALAVFSSEMLKNGASIDGFKAADLHADLLSLTS